MKKSIFIFIFIIAKTLDVASQCTADAGPDKFICNSGSVTIGPANQTSGYSYSWNPISGLNNANIYNPTASPSSTTTYTLTMLADNLLSNPGFESGLTDFGTDFGTCSQSSSGEACVVGSVIGACTINSFADSKMLFGITYNINPTNYRLWYQTKNVTTNSNYRFSGFMNNGPGSGSGGMSGSNCSFEVRIIGNNTGTTTTSFTATSFCNNWQGFAVDWSSGSNTSVTLEIRLSTTGGVTLFLDNLYFGCKATDQVVVNKTTSAPSITPVGPITYYYWYEDTRQVLLTANKAGQWYKNNVAISGATGTTYTATYSGNGTPTDTFKCVNACGASNLVRINAIGCTTDSQYPVFIPPKVSCPATAAAGWNLSQVNKGTNATYLWELPNAVYWQVDDNYSRNVFFNLGDIGAPWPATQYVNTKAVSAIGSETRMSFGVGLANGCRTAPRTSDEPFTPKTTLLYPNPAKDEITIKSNIIIRTISIMDATGRLKRNIKPARANQVKVNISNLSTGVYHVEVTDDVKKQVLKFIVTR